MAKVLVTGASGFLGRKTCAVFAAKGFDTVRTAAQAQPGALAMDVTDADACGKVIAAQAPDWVVNCAGAADVDWCEDNEAQAMTVNGQAAGNVARAARTAGACVLQVSTDYVFDGTKKGTYVEDDGPNPLSVYAKSKREGERQVEGAGGTFVIARVAALYGFNGTDDKSTFVTKVVSQLLQKKTFAAFADQWCTPSLIDDCAEAFALLVKRNETGVFHVAGSECVNRFDFAVKTAQAFGLDKTLIKMTLLQKVGFRAPRPARTCLDTGKLAGLGMRTRNVSEGLAEMRRQVEASGALAGLR